MSVAMPDLIHPIVDPLDTYREGLASRAVENGWETPHPCPLAATSIDVDVHGGFATVATARTFRNVETVAIEATLTFPVPVDAVMHGLVVAIDGRTLRAGAQARTAARDTYEDAMDAGHAAVLHEEVLRGIHKVCVGQLAPGATCVVTSTWSAITDVTAHGRSLRIPTTVGAVYGRLPLSPADDLVTGTARARARLCVRLAAGSARVEGESLACKATGVGQGVVLEGEVDLGHAIDLMLHDGATGPLTGHAADGRPVRLDVLPEPIGEMALELAILFDRSGSTGAQVRADATATVWSTMRDAVKRLLLSLGDDDAVTLYAFDSVTERVGRGRGRGAAKLADTLGQPRGGTEIGGAIETALAAGATDILLLTDGQSGALDVQSLGARGARISALLVGPASLEALVGHLAAMTGGRLGCTSGADATEWLGALGTMLRTPANPATSATATALPTTLQAVRGGSRISVTWGQVPAPGENPGADAMGAYVAALALPHMTACAAEQTAIAHGLCTHLTSLVIVDEAGPTQDAIPATRKVLLPRPYAAAPCAATPMLAEASAPPSLQRSRVASPAAVPPAMSDVQAFPTLADPDLAGVGRSIVWSKHVVELAAGKLDGLARAERDTLKAAATMPDIFVAAALAGIPALVLAAALAALVVQASDPAAARLVRRIAAKFGAQAFGRLAALYGIHAPIARKRA